MNTLKFVFFIIKRFYSYLDVKSKKQLPPGIQDLFRLRRTNYFYVNVIMTYCFLRGAFGHIFGWLNIVLYMRGKFNIEAFASVYTILYKYSLVIHPEGVLSG